MEITHFLSSELIFFNEKPKRGRFKDTKGLDREEYSDIKGYEKFTKCV